MKFDWQGLCTAKYAIWVMRGLLFLFSVLILRMYLQYWFTPLLPRSFEAVAPPTVSVNPSKSMDYLLHSALFGLYVPNNLEEAQVRKSTLNLTLVGILLADKVEESEVILEAANREQNTYKMGDLLPGGGKIERITAGGVLIEHNGNLERLSLPKERLIIQPLEGPLKQE